jgi:hypothetical protein
MAVGAATAARVHRPLRAMCVRSEQAALGGRSGDALLELCTAQRIELLLAAAPEPKGDAQQRWRSFLSRAHERGIRVHALAGEAQWGLVQESAAPGDRPEGPMLAAGRSLALRHIGSIIAYNRSVASGERFDGVHHDIPIWHTEEYASAKDSPRRATILANYVEQLWGCAHFLRTLGRVAIETDGPAGEFGTSIAAGLDEATTWGKPGQYKEATLPASQQVIRTADYTVVMIAADTSDAIVGAARQYVQFAGEVSRQVFVGVSTAPVGDAGASATFGDASRGSMEQVLAEVFARLRAEPGFGGIVIDSYSTYAAMKP